MPESALLIVWRLKSWPVPVGQEKRSHGGPVRSEISACEIFACRIPVAGRNPAGGDGADSGRPAAGGLLRRATEPQLVFEPVQFTRSHRAAAATASGRQRGRQGR